MEKKGGNMRRGFGLIGVIVGMQIVASVYVVADTTYISGIMDKDTVWRRDRSPYVVTGNVLVDNGVRLDIEPGVKVFIDSEKYIMVKGTLNAIGTATDSIIISARNIANRWGRLWFKLQSTCTLKYCRIEYACSSAINMESASGYVGYSTITNNTSQWWEGGIYIERGSATITNNTISNNTGGGIRIGDPIRPGGGTATITNNTFTNNTAYNGGGIYISGRGATITNNTIEYNSARSGGSIYIFRGETSIKYNTITDATASAIYLENCDLLYIRTNNLSATGYAVYNNTGNNIDARYNWWNTTNSSVIDAKIYDFYDDFNKGKVFYRPFLLAPFTETVPPEAPTNLTANGSNPSPWTNNPEFVINWENPADPSGILEYFYKLGAPPTHDFDTTGTFNASPDTITITQQGGQPLYLWLVDGAGNINHNNYASVLLRYDATPPEVSSVSPANGETGVAISRNIEATFSENIHEGTLSPTSFVVRGSRSGAISGVISYNPSTYTATFAPESNFGKAETIFVTLKESITDIAGNRLPADYSWFFITLGPQIAISDTFHNYGITTINFFKDWRLKIYNKGDDTLTITQVTSSHQAFRVQESFPQNILAGDTLGVTVRFLPTTQDTFRCTLAVTHDAPNTSTLSTYLYGIGGTPIMNVFPDTLITTLSPGGRGVQTLYISNNGNGLLVWEVDEDGDIPWVSENPTSGRTHPESESEVIVIFDAGGLDLGTYTGRLVVSGNDPNNPSDSVALILEVKSTIPDPPQNLTATHGNRKVILTWAPTVGFEIAGYRIYRNITGSVSYTQIAEVGDTTTFTDTIEIVNGTKFYYVVTAVDTASPPNESGYSNQASARPSLSRPTGLRWDLNDPTGELKWDANPETNLLGYKLCHGPFTRSYDRVVDVSNVVQYDLDQVWAPGWRNYEYITCVAYDSGRIESEYAFEEWVITLVDTNAGEYRFDILPGGKSKQATRAIELHLPRGTLTSPTKIGVDRELEPNISNLPGEYVGFTVNISPQELTFSRDVTLVFQYRDEDVTGFNEATISIYRYTGTGWESVGSNVDTLSNTVSGSITTLGMFTLSITDNQGPIFSNTTSWGDTVFQGPFPVRTTVKDPSGISEVTLYWKPNGGNWTSLSMTNITNSNDYIADIPGVTQRTQINYYLKATDRTGAQNTTTDPVDAPSSYYSFIAGRVGFEDEPSIPRLFSLSESYPNPATRTITILYSIPKPAHAVLEIYDISGTLVATLVDKPHLSGCYSVTWNRKDNRGREVGSGIYFYHLKAGSFKATKKIILVK